MWTNAFSISVSTSQCTIALCHCEWFHYVSFSTRCFQSLHVSTSCIFFSIFWCYFLENTRSLSGMLSLTGRELCDFLYVIGAARSFRQHPMVAETLAKSLCRDVAHYDRELQLWPQTLPLVCEYLAWHLDGRLMTQFLASVLAPFWREHPFAVQGPLVLLLVFFNTSFRNRIEWGEW